MEKKKTREEKQFLGCAHESQNCSVRSILKDWWTRVSGVLCACCWFSMLGCRYCFLWEIVVGTLLLISDRDICMLLTLVNYWNKRLAIRTFNAIMDIYLYRNNNWFTWRSVFDRKPFLSELTNEVLTWSFLPPQSAFPMWSSNMWYYLCNFCLQSLVRISKLTIWWVLLEHFLCWTCWNWLWRSWRLVCCFRKSSVLS